MGIGNKSLLHGFFFFSQVDTDLRDDLKHGKVLTMEGAHGLCRGSKKA